MRKKKWLALSSLYAVQSLCAGNDMFGVYKNGPHHVIGELCYKGTILQRNYRKRLKEL